MLGRHRSSRPDPSASYAVAWAHLRQRYPGLRTIVVTGASSRDDPTAAAVGLADAAVRLDGGSVLLMVLDSAMRDRRMPDFRNPSVKIIAALRPGQLRSILSDTGDEYAFVIVVAPPPQQGPDCITMARTADATIVAARSGRTRFGEARLAAELLRDAGVAIAAALLLTTRGLRRGTPEASAVSNDGEIAELRPRAQLLERREVSAGIDVLT